MNYKDAIKMRVHAVVMPIVEKTAYIVDDLTMDIANDFSLSYAEARKLVDEGMREVNEAMEIIDAHRKMED